jgi:hypothetical protein
MDMDETEIDEWLFKIIETHGGEGIWHEINIVFRITEDGVLQVDETRLKRLPRK